MSVARKRALDTRGRAGSEGELPQALAQTGGARVHRPTPAQRRYLARGLEQAGGKLPLFDGDGKQIDSQTVRACLKSGWTEPWFANPLKPDWLICRLTPEGRAVLRWWAA
jgi:hypothetical protein